MNVIPINSSSYERLSLKNELAFPACSLTTDLFLRIMYLLPGPDISRNRIVCKNWKICIDCNQFWRMLLNREGIPRVQGLDIDDQEVYRQLFPMTISGRAIRSLMGLDVGPIPEIHQSFFEMLDQPDPTEDAWKDERKSLEYWAEDVKNTKIRDNFVLVVIPNVSLAELIDLCKDPEKIPGIYQEPEVQEYYRWDDATKRDHGRSEPRIISRYSADVFKEHSKRPGTVQVVLMRKKIVVNSFGLPWDSQTRCLEKTRFTAPSIRVRTFYNMIIRLQKGRFAEDMWEYARSPEIFYDAIVKDSGRLVVGNGNRLGGRPGFEGVYIGITHKDDDIRVGVAPCKVVAQGKPFFKPQSANQVFNKSLSMGKNSIQYLMKLVKTHGKNLTRLDLKTFSLTSEDLKEIIQSCPNLTYLSIRGSAKELPMLPEGLEEFRCNCYRLSQLPELPKKLKILDCCGCLELSQVPELPEELKIFDCSDAELSELPELPESLEVLKCRNMEKLVKLPGLPKNLKKLDYRWSDNLILPPHLPEGCRVITQKARPGNKG